MWQVDVETAGRNPQQEAEISVVGLENAQRFREAILETRKDYVKFIGGGGNVQLGGQPVYSGGAQNQFSQRNEVLLTEIRDTLVRIENSNSNVKNI